MKTIPITEVPARLAAEPQVYLLAGPEQFLQEENLTKLKTAFLTKGSAEFNFNVFYADTHSARQVLECAWSFPFLGGKRVVLTRDVERFSREDKEILLTYVKGRSSEHACLILQTAQTNLNQGFLLDVRKYARVIFCAPLKDRELSAWIRERIKENDKKITQEAEELLREYLGADLLRMSSVITNLVLYAGSREVIGRDDVVCLTGADLSANAFELFDAVSAGNAARALGILDALLKDAVHPAQILGAFAYKIISGKRDGSVFERRIKHLCSADRDIKSGRNPRIVMELLIARLVEQGVRP